MSNSFSSKADKIETTTNNINSIEELANRLMRENRDDQLETELEKINISNLSNVEKEAFFHIYGICAFRRGNHELAKERFANGLKHMPNNQMLMFSLGQEYIFLKNPENAFKEFDKCSFPNVYSAYVLAMSRYAYLYNEFLKGMKYVSQFFPYYYDLKSLDDNFLYTRGLPFFSITWQHYASHCILSNNVKELSDFTASIKEKCQDYNFNELYIELNAYTTRNYEQLIKLLDYRIDEGKKYNIPSGYNVVRIACFNALAANSYPESIKLLDSIKLSNHDFQWLTDIIILAKANMANKFNVQADEDRYKEQFLRNQPLLFEPEHALSFGLLPYQEKLKVYWR